MTNATQEINETKAAPTDTMDEWELVDESQENKSKIEEVKEDENDVVVEESIAAVVEEVAELTVSPEKPKESVSDWVRKTSVAVAGGTMVGVGLIMIPLPTPCGGVVAGAGMAVLGTEFPAAQRAMNQTCNKFADVIERSLPKDAIVEESDAKVFANESMKDIMEDKKKTKNAKFKSAVKQIGQKAVPAIRKIGDGIDKEQLARASDNVSNATLKAKNVMQTQASKMWRHIMVLDEGEGLMTPFAK